jgi:hypothetical protein
MIHAKLDREEIPATTIEKELEPVVKEEKKKSNFIK